MVYLRCYQQSFQEEIKRINKQMAQEKVVTSEVYSGDQIKKAATAKKRAFCTFLMGLIFLLIFVILNVLTQRPIPIDDKFNSLWF